MWFILPWTFSRQRGTKNHLFILCCLQPSVSEALRFFFCSDLKQVYRLVSSVFVLIFWYQIVCTYKSRESPVNDMYEVVQCRLCWILRSYIDEKRWFWFSVSFRNNRVLQHQVTWTLSKYNCCIFSFVFWVLSCCLTLSSVNDTDSLERRRSSAECLRLKCVQLQLKIKILQPWNFYIKGLILDLLLILFLFWCSSFIVHLLLKSLWEIFVFKLWM